MFRLVVRLVFLLLFTVSSAYGDGIDLVKVRLKKNLKTLSISGSFKSIGKYKFKDESLNYALKISSKKYKNSNYWIVENTNNNKRLVFKSSRLTIVGSSLKSQQDKLPPHFVLWTENKKLQVVAELPMDMYLQGVLAGETPLSWPKEALKAQAIASKSYALSVASERKNNYYHLDGDVYDQVYKHSTKYSKKLEDIISETSREYLVAPDGRVLKAYYHSNSGGKTELPINVWQDENWNPHYQIVESPDANKWNYKINYSDLVKKLTKEPTGFGAQSIQSLDYNEKSPSGRVTSLKYKANNGTLKTITGQKFRELVGFGKIKSTFFTMAKANGVLHFSGKGFGHGVGMSQNGANKLARKGWSYKSILNHFYPKVSVKRGPAGD